VRGRFFLSRKSQTVDAFAKTSVLSGDAFVFGKVVESIIEGFFQDDVDSWIFGGHRKT
jgi:hypothetical protein